MDIGSVHGYLADLLETVEVEDGQRIVKVKRVRKFTPPARESITDLPTAHLGYLLKTASFQPNALHQEYEIRLQLFVGRAAVQADKAEDLASKFLDAIIRLLSKNLTLGRTVQLIHEVTDGGGGETLTLLQWGQEGYVGLDLKIPVLMRETWEHHA